MRQRYNPFGGAERFVARALPALERSRRRRDAHLAQRRGLGRAARRCASIPFYVGKPVARLVVRPRGARAPGGAKASTSCSRTSASRAAMSTAPATACIAAGSSCARTAPAPLERLGIALNPVSPLRLPRPRTRMFEHPAPARRDLQFAHGARRDPARASASRREKLHVIYNGVDLEHFHPRDARALRGAARAELGCRPRDTLFLFVGSGFARKGLDAAIEALEAAANDVVLAGRRRHATATSDVRRQAALARRTARRASSAARKTCGRSTPAADCLILPSRYDPFPNTALEALAMGLPASSARAAARPRSSSPGVNGWVCEPDDPQGSPP